MQYKGKVKDLEITISDEDVVSVVKPNVIPDNLTGYTVTVPPNWTAPAGYGKYNIVGRGGWNGTLQFDMQGFGIGISKAWEDYEGNCAFTTDISNPSNLNTYSRPNTDGIILNIVSGTDATNQLLKQWFVDNNATFTKSQSGGAN